MRSMRWMLPLLLGLAACSPPPDVHETRFIMGTLVEFTIADADSESARQAIADAASEMRRIENLFTIQGGVRNAVKDFNASSPGAAMRLPAEVEKLLLKALAVQQQSHGAFSPLLGRLDLLWGFSAEPPPSAPPPASAVKDALPPPSCLRRDGHAWIRTHRNCMLDFGGIAKGYAIDRGIAVLKAHGIHNAIVNAGGDIRLIGSHHGKPWRIGIRHPRRKGQVLGMMELSGDVSVVTSGDYERYFIHDGKRYHHILDPETGWPANASQSATVIAARATWADAWSTALFVLGKKGLSLLEKQGLAALVVDRQGSIHINMPMKKIFHAMHEVDGDAPSW